MRLTRPPRLWTLLLLGNTAVLALPLAGLWAMRLYESALVRQTESELVAQAAVLAGVLRERLDARPAADGPPGPAGLAATALLVARRPGLDLAADPVLPPQPDPRPGSPPVPASSQAGQSLLPVLRDAQAFTLASLRVTDRNGTVVATTGADRGLSLAAWPEVRAVLAGQLVAAGMHAREAAKPVPGGISRTAGLRVFVALAAEAEDGSRLGIVVLSRTPNTLAAALWGKRWPLLLFLLVLLAGGAAMAALLSRLVARPLGRVVAQARSVAAGGSMVPLQRPGTREVAALSDALGSMAATLARRAGLISGFAGSVSHEFKAPLAAIRAAAELLEEHGDSLAPGERARLSGLLVDGVSRLDHLVTRLVEVARADVIHANPARTAEAAVAAVMDRAAAPFRGRGLDVRIAGAGSAAITGEALEATLSVLIDNAATHAPAAPIDLSSVVEGDRCRITVADRGPGIPAADRERVFEPFFTTARERGGTGLGLPIARSLVTASGGTLRIIDSPAGTTFLIDLAARHAAQP